MIHGTYHFVFDTRKTFTEYEASFLDEAEAAKFAKTLGEFAYLTTDLNRTLVRLNAGSGRRRR